ncbi:hypothetical protein CQA58_07605 [Helicobacter brantae]|uniref:Uncharacterized protein n=2 Tax=Helicobacter brantae TaxID=375927 RepID=A0A3D8IWZ5_9HELI|nr:hypothetical protein CQA58_07605 [Helicobacter brantae]
MTHYYCIPNKINNFKSYIHLDENIYFNLIREITNTFEVYQVFRPKFLSKITKKQKITLDEFSQLEEKIPYRIKSSSLRDWESFDCYEWMQSYHSDHILIIEKPKIVFYVTCHCFIRVFINEKNIKTIAPILKKHDFFLDRNIARSEKSRRIYARQRKLSSHQVAKLIEKEQYERLVYLFQMEEDFLSPPSHHSNRFFITLWDHWIKDNQEFKRLIVEYFPNAYLLKTQPTLMSQKQANEDKLLNFLMWLSSKSEVYRIYLDNQKLVLKKMYRQDLINSFYMGARLGRGYSLYFPKTKILINTINEDYCMEAFIFDKNKEIKTKIQEMELYVLN